MINYDKIAIVHDWLVVDGGAEKVMRAILEIYPNADIFSLVDFLNDRDRSAILNGKSVKTSFLQKLPFAKKHFRNYLPLFPKAIESFDLSAYDTIISSSWAVAKGVKKSNKQIHISYCHTPIRYAWDLYDEYSSNIKQPKKILVQQTLKYIRKWDIETLNRVDYFIANSKFVQERIKRIYNRDSIVIYPPVDINSFTLHIDKKDFYLTASRLVPYKKTQLIVEAFNLMPHKKLIVIGEGEEYHYIKSIAKSNIEVLGYQDRVEMIAYMQQAKAFIYAAIEDFGIVPIEAMACGTPVVALDEGGTRETIIDGITGIHFAYQTKESIIEAIDRFEECTFDYNKIREHSIKYTKFKRELSTFISTIY